MLKVLVGWLDSGSERVSVDGVFSDEVVLSNMVFQGAVLGPPVWNCYYEDARKAVSKSSFVDTVFADDLNCFCVFDGCHGDRHILDKIRE